MDLNSLNYFQIQFNHPEYQAEHFLSKRRQTTLVLKFQTLVRKYLEELKSRQNLEPEKDSEDFTLEEITNEVVQILGKPERSDVIEETTQLIYKNNLSVRLKIQDYTQIKLEVEVKNDKDFKKLTLLISLKKGDKMIEVLRENLQDYSAFTK